ncbi:hypothetical protein [Bosea sp. 124]|uniref:hypothetical protein n=1 Tax=Bosea sp. 124 TaxID=2135642 RepID=UPI000D4544E8|nr:hypothetical protein [Bosea sp. 124]PTM39465.1 hypothetical protein C8D03_0957 [Bosea sp. 124]
MIITTVDEYEAATHRARQLADHPEGTPESTELAEIIAAITIWDAPHDDASAWND